jgi:hypothetical protein
MHPEDREEQSLHELFATLRARVYPPRPREWRAQLQRGLARADGPPGERRTLLGLLGSGVVQALNLLGALLRPRAARPPTPRQPLPPDDDG